MAGPAKGGDSGNGVNYFGDGCSTRDVRYLRQIWTWVLMEGFLEEYEVSWQRTSMSVEFRCVPDQSSYSWLYRGAWWWPAWVLVLGTWLCNWVCLGRHAWTIWYESDYLKEKRHPTAKPSIGGSRAKIPVGEDSTNKPRPVWYTVYQYISRMIVMHENSTNKQNQDLN